MYSKKLFGINTLSWSVGSMGFPPEWPWRVGWVKNFLSWWISTLLKSFLVASRLLPSCSSTFHQTNIESAQMCSEDHLSVSRIRPHHLLLEAFLRAEEECSVFLPLGTLDQIELLVQYQSIFCHGIGTGLVDEQMEVGLLGFALSFERLAYTNTSVFNANNSVFVSEVSCSSSSYSLSIKSVTNLFNPWEFLNHEWEELSVYKFISNSHSIFTLQVTGCDFQHGFNFGVPSNPSGLVDSSSRGKVYSQHVSGSVNCKNSSVCFVMKYCPTSTVSGILHKNKSLSIGPVVQAFPLVLCTSAIKFLVQVSQSSVWVSLSMILLARTMGRISLSQQVSLCLFDRYCTIHTILRLLRRYSADWQKWLCEKQFQSYPNRHRSVPISVHLLFFWAFLETMDSWLGRLGVRFLWIWSSSIQQLCPILLAVFRWKVEYHFVSDPGPRNVQRPAGNFANTDTSEALAMHSRSLSVKSHTMSLNINMQIIRPWNCAGFAHFVHELVDFLNELQCCESWENVPPEFHRFSISCVHCSVLSWIFEPMQLLFPNRIWCWILNHLSKTKHRARHWCLLHHWPEITVSIENLPSWFETLQKSHLVVPISSTFQTCRTSASQWDLSLYFWRNVNCLSNSFSWIQMLPMLKT